MWGVEGVWRWVEFGPLQTPLFCLEWAVRKVCVLLAAGRALKLLCGPAVIPSRSAEPAELPKDKRDSVLNGDITLAGIARKIQDGSIRDIVVVCGNAV